MTSIMEPKFKAPDFSGDLNDTDKVLVVEGKKFHVHSTVLSLWSPVFSAMLKGNFKEKRQDKIVLPGKKADVFEKFLLAIYDMKVLEKYLVQKHSCLRGIFSVNAGMGIASVVSEDAYKELFILLEYLREYQVNKVIYVIESELVRIVDALKTDETQQSATIRDEFDVYMRLCHLADEFSFVDLYKIVYPCICQFKFTSLLQHSKFSLLKKKTQENLKVDVPAQLEEFLKRSLEHCSCSFSTGSGYYRGPARRLRKMYVGFGQLK